MNKTRSVVAFACFSTFALLAACKPAEAPTDSRAPAPAAEAPAAATEPAMPPPVDTANPASAPTDAAIVGAEYPLARDACLAEVAKKTGVPQDKLVATEVLWAEAGVGVTVQVPDADAPWSCLSDEKGKVQGAAYTGSEGKL